METCSRKREDIGAYAYDELPEEQRIPLEAHISECPACQALLKEEQDLRGLMGDSPPRKPSESLVRACRSALRWRLRGPQHKGVLGRLWLPIPSLGIQTVGALAILLIGLLIGYKLSPSRRAAVHIPSQDIQEAAYVSSEAPRAFAMNEEPQIISLQFLAYDPGKEQVTLRLQATSDLTLRGRVDDEPIRRVLTWAIRQNVNAGARIESIELLGRWMDDEIRDALVAALDNDENTGVRLEAIQALKEVIGDEQVKQAFLRVLKDEPNPGIRILAVQALSSLAGEVPRSAFEKAAEEDQNNYVRMLARNALVTTSERMDLNHGWEEK